ncbi:hypothetical protein O1L60_17650 [Streptomyces diastatochromogenes]|nr:hypothetical protein [Streptomyces diastatochromogenes]
MSEAPGGDGVAHENRDGDDAPERHAVEADGAAPETPDALDERDEPTGQRMVKIEPGTGDGDDELALRRLFQDAVSGLEPSHGSLEHLRRAVPARRARKRQALVGAAPPPSSSAPPSPPSCTSPPRAASPPPTP